MLDLWLIRHAESLGNLDGTHGDTELSPPGQEQARRLTRALSGFIFDSVWSSPLLRAQQTAALALPGSALIVDDRLAELEAATGPHFVDTSNVVELQALLARPARPPEESGKAFMARVNAWRDGLPREGRVIAFTHFGVVRELLAAFFGFRRAPQEIAYTGIFRLAVGSSVPDVLAWNDNAHTVG
jgi:broad specificity phosphatase PhoE